MPGPELARNTMGPENAGMQQAPGATLFPTPKEASNNSKPQEAPKGLTEIMRELRDANLETGASDDATNTLDGNDGHSSEADTVVGTKEPESESEKPKPKAALAFRKVKEKIESFIKPTLQGIGKYSYKTWSLILKLAWVPLLFLNLARTAEPIHKFISTSRR